MIFLSYARRDGEFALKLARDLRAANVDVWVDQLNIAAGQPWDHVVEAALRSSAQLVVILSPDAVASRSVMDEVSFALGEDRLVLPAIYRACEIPFRLRRLQHVSFEADYASGLARLVAALPAGNDTGVAIDGAATPKTSHQPASPPEPQPVLPPAREPVLPSRLGRALRLALGGAAATGLATFLIYSNDVRFRGEFRQPGKLAGTVGIYALVAAVAWLIVGLVAARYVRGIRRAVIGGIAVVLLWVAISGSTYADVIASALMFGAPIGGLIGTFAARPLKRFG